MEKYQGTVSMEGATYSFIKDGNILQVVLVINNSDGTKERHVTLFDYDQYGQNRQTCYKGTTEIHCPLHTEFEDIYKEREARLLGEDIPEEE